MARTLLSQSFRTIVLSAGVGVLAIGCGKADERTAQPLTADQFVNRAASVPPDGGRLTGAPVEAGGAVAVDGVGRRPIEPAPSADPLIQPQRISPAIDQSVRGASTGNGNAGTPSTLPANLTGGPATGPVANGGPRAVDVGFVVMEVNGKAIYSDKILAALERPLATEAKKKNAANFRALATELLERQVQLYKRDELEFAAADLALTANDKMLAQALTAQWRQQQITSAGGSIELARRKASDEGWDFEDLLQQQYRQKIVQIYYQKRILPQVFVPPADQRAYYERNKAKEFSKPSRLKFRVIKIDPTAGFGSDGDAVTFASKIKERTKSEDFAKIAEEVNKDGKGGAAGLPETGHWVDANSYANEQIEKVATSLKPGEVSDVIAGDGKTRRYYIVKLEAIQEGKVQAFEDPGVQELIIQKLRGQQILALRETMVRKLERDAVTRRNEGKLNDLLDIVMRKYPEWAKAG